MRKPVRRLVSAKENDTGLDLRGSHNLHRLENRHVLVVQSNNTGRIVDPDFQRSPDQIPDVL